jgi:leader peptidase (prepilin peptidase)/N-methyltransferase
MSTPVVAVLAGLFGALAGSLANVLAHRLPRGEALVPPVPSCPHCAATLRGPGSVPILGWLLLGGRCSACQEPLPPRYPIVEALTAALAVAVILTRYATIERVLGLMLLAVLIPSSLIDLDTRKIPNRITGPAAVGAILAGLLLKPSAVPTQLIAGAAGFLFLFVFALANPKGLGMGDVKLAGVLGLYLGGPVVVALFAAVVAGALAGLGVIAHRGVRVGRKTGIPFGPFLAVGGVVAILAGHPILHWYAHHLAGH